MKSQPVVHVGFPKCASTFLQKQIFPNLQTYEYIADARPGLDPAIRNYYPQLGDSPWIAGLKGRRVAVSLERLLGFLYSPAMHPEKAIDAGILNIFRYMGTAVTFIVVVRRQDDLVLSRLRHKHKVVTRAAHLFLDFPLRKGPCGEFHGVTKAGVWLSSLDYYNRIMPLVYLFGRENVHVLLYEELRDSPQRFLEALSVALGEDVTPMISRIDRRENVSVREVPPQHWAVQKLDSMLGGRLATFLPRRTLSLAAGFQSELTEIYRPGNRRLAEFFDLDLDRYGYC